MRAVLWFVAAICIFGIYSCDEMDVNGKSQIVHDSLVNIFPRWQALKIKVGENNTSMLIVMGDATFYNAPKEEQAQKAEELGRMILRIYGKGNYLEKGNLIVTADIHNNSEAPPDGINIPIDFSALKKAGQ